jgi:molecular chaperone DnaK
MGQQIYEQEQAAAQLLPGAADSSAKRGDEEVVDAEFSEVDEENKG